MAQSYTSITSTTTLANSLTPLVNRDDAAASCFSGTAFPSSNLLLGQFCYRTDQLKLYQLTNLTGPVWTLIYDLSSGVMVAPNASVVPWSGITGKPTTVSGYGITDALKKTGDSATGKISFLASSASAASISVPHGVAPSAPVNGDIWTATDGLYARINGSTFSVSFQDAAETFSAKKTFVAGSTNSASLNVPAGAAPTTPASGDLWATSTQLVYNMAGTSKNVAFWDASSRLPVANGGTGASDAATARTNLGIVNPPTGCIMMYAGATAPSGWAWCDGSWLSRTANSALFAVIGTAFGAGDGSTNFAVPDFRGRVGVGRDNMGGTSAGRVTSAVSGIAGTILGATGGQQTYILTIGELPAHGHPMRIAVIDDSTPRTDTSGGIMIRTNSATSYGAYTGTVSDTVGRQIGGTGSGQDHLNMQPSIIVNYIIKL